MKLKTYTQRACRQCPERRRDSFLHRLGIVLMVVGALFLLVFVPLRVWLAMIGLLLLILGFLLFWLG